MADMTAFLERRDWMGLLARAKPARLAELFPDLPAHDLVRPSEIGAAMVQGRVGGAGQPFNLGEITVTRCSLRLADGAIGHAYVQGRNQDHALRAALVDALMQTDRGAATHTQVIAPLQSDEQTARSISAAKAAATKVEFFTLVRGEDK